MKKYDTIEVIEFQAPQPSDIRLCVTGSIHGNEKCGYQAISKVIEEIKAGKLQLKSGTVRFLPKCNPRAFDENKRFIDINLNRIIGYHEHPQSYEARLADQIAPHLDWASHVFDIHSYTSDDIAFVFCDRDEPTLRSYANQTACHHMILDMHQMVKEKTNKSYSSVQGYGLVHDKIACTLEAGQHDSPNSFPIAYQSLVNMLTYLNIIEEGHEKSFEKTTVIRANNIFYKEKPGAFTQRWHNFQAVKKGTPIGLYEDGEEVLAPRDCVLYLPRDGEVGAEWFYTAIPAD